MLGKTISHYKILEKIGQGGMGEVYRATDTKLNRDVALKILPEQFASDSQRMGRFQREAEVLASLDHPNIGQIYGIEDAGQTKALVLQLIEGPTLADRIIQGPIPLEEALKIALQITEGLEAAHEKGVIHRDLKPANIKITPEGQVKILDFGLAKALEAEVPASSLSQSPTLTNAATQAGVILGTAAYMSPEQAKGKTVDKRADIFAFGAVLYECLTGKRAFEGEDISDTLASILAREPEWAELPQNIPWNIRTLLRRSFQKDPGDRLKDIGDARLEIKEYLADPTAGATVEAEQGTPPHLDRQRWLPWALAAVLAGSTLYTVFWSRPALPETPVRKFELLVPSLGTEQRPPQISPDGAKIVYFSQGQLWIRELDQWQPRALDGTQDALFPCWSPDSSFVAYLANGRLMKVPISGGEPQVVAAVTGSLGGSASCTWEPNGRILIAGTDFGLLAVSSQGGDPEEVLPRNEGELDFHEVSQLSGGAVLFSTHEGSLESFDGSTRKEILKLENESFGWPIYSESGHLIYYRSTTNPGIWAVPFSLSRQEMTGQPFLVVSNAAYPSLSREGQGTLAYVPGTGGVTGQGTFVWVDREGREEAVVAEPRAYQEFSLSPDGTKIAVRVTDPDNEDVWIYDLVRDTQMRLTFDPATERFPIWTPDGQRVAFGSAEAPLSWKAADGTGEVETLVEGSRAQLPQAFSPDGTVLVLWDRNSGSDLGMLSLEGERTPTPLLETEFLERSASLSPDGRWLAYESNESGQFEVYVRPFPDVSGGRWQVSSGGGAWPLWSPNGRELFYTGSEGMMAVPIETGPTFTQGTVDLLFDLVPYVSPPALSFRRVAISPEGDRFLMLKAGGGSDETAETTSIHVVLNWFEELKERVPVP